MALTLGFSFNPHLGWSETPQPRVFSAIDVQGNSRFRDEDILATSGLQTGVPLGQDDLESAFEALQFTGEFESVEITSKGDTLIIRVDEAAQYSGGLTFGAGLDTDSGLFGIVGLALDGALGPTSQLRGTLLFADEVQTLDLSVQSPSFWGADRRGGVRLGFGNFEYDNVTYQYRFAEIEPYIQFDLGTTSQLELRYTLSERRVSNVDAAASPIIQSETGSRINSGIGFTLATFSGESSEGFGNDWFVRLDQDFTGVGGDTTFSTTQIALGGKRAIGARGFAIRTRVEMGAVVGFDGDNPRVSERFTLGGAQLRGFERGTISPKDVCAGCASDGGDIVTDLGGNYFAVARTDLLVPLFPQNPGIETFVFFDIGSAWDVDTVTGAQGTLQDSSTARSSAGIGTSFDTELGKFEAYLALHTDSAQQDDEQEFGLTFRTDF